MTKTKQDIENIIEELKNATDNLNSEETQQAYVFIEALSKSPTRFILPPGLAIDSYTRAQWANARPQKPAGSTNPSTGEMTCPHCGKTLKITVD